MNKYIVTDYYTNYITIIGSVKQIADYYNVKESTVRANLSKGHKLLGRYVLTML